MSRERQRLEQDRTRRAHWRRWGPYLSERQWGTVREDYSEDGDAWAYFPYEHAHSRAYRWGDDGLLGLCDNHGRICLAPALWNERDEILKERLFGLSGAQGNHGEDVKEQYYYEDALPSHAYNRALYKYPHAAFPYTTLRAENARRGKQDDEYELLDTGVFDEDRYTDLSVEYAKAGPSDILVRFTLTNRGPEPAPVHLIPQLWFRNVWSFGRGSRPHATAAPHACGHAVVLSHADFPGYVLYAPPAEHLLFTENETNHTAIDGAANVSTFTKDAFHRFVVDGEHDAVNPARRGSKVGLCYRRVLASGESWSVSLRLTDQAPADPLGASFDAALAAARADADEFYAELAPPTLDVDARNVQRAAFAGLLWSKQSYHYIVQEWLDGDLTSPPPPPSRLEGRNSEWRHLYADDVLSMPDKWEFPWFASWDLAFHCIPLALLDPEFAKRQLSVLTREWYMHPNGALPAYEWNFSDVNPPVLAWSAWRVYLIDRRATGRADRRFLERVFQKLLLNFTWWVNRKDQFGNNVFEGGFLGLDNIGLFDRSQPLPTGGVLQQSDGTSWMAMYALGMLKIALELARENSVYEDIASKFFEHFVAIGSAVFEHGPGNQSLFDEEDGFFYDQIRFPDGHYQSLKIRSLVGLVPLFAMDTLEREDLEQLPDFARRTRWFLEHHADRARHVVQSQDASGRLMLSLVSPERLRRILGRMLDEQEFYSPHGVRSLSKEHAQHPYELEVDGTLHRVQYAPGESRTGMFGGNSNWRGPVWMPMNFLLVEALQKYHHFLGDEFRVQCPSGAGPELGLWAVAADLSRRLVTLFLRDPVSGERACFGAQPILQTRPAFRDHLLFNEYFHGDNGSGRGASHQTGWTALVAKLLQQGGEYDTLERPR